MKGPFLDEPTPPKSGAKKAAAKGAVKARGVAKGGAKGAAKPGKSRSAEAAVTTPPVPRLPRVRGGKALARLHFFERQRNIEETDISRKDTDKPTAKFVGEARSTARTSARSLARSAAPASGRTPGARAGSGPASPYVRAFAHKAHLDTTAPATPVEQRWRPLGPFSIPHGQTYGEGPGSRPSVSGRINAVAVDPGNANHILIGSGGGGVWETRDGGKNWQPRTDDQPSLAIGALAIDPSNPLVVYAGTGEGDSISALGVGVLRSTDGGATWTHHARAPFEGIGFYDLVVDPSDSDHILAATTDGLFESTDGGTAWSKRRNKVTWGVSMHPAVAGNPGATKEVFAACEDGLFRSTNGGTSWSAVALPGLPGKRDRIEVCHAPSDGNVVYVWAAGPPSTEDPFEDDVRMPTPYLWRRNVLGGAFAAQAPPPDVQTSQAWYDWFAGVAPNNPNVLYLGAINVHRGVRSASGAWTWKNISAKTSGQSIHPDQHAIAFSPSDPNVVFVGNDGGLYRSPDAGVSWQSLNKGLNITEFEFLAQHPQFETWLLGGTQDNGTLRYEGEEVWYHVEDGDGGDCGINNESPYTCYQSFYGMAFQHSTTGGGWESWAWVSPDIPESDNYPNGSLFYPPLEVNGRVIVRAGKTVYISTDAGETWDDVALPAVAKFASALAVPTPARVYVGTETGRIYRLDLVGGAWSNPVLLGRPANGFVSDLLVDPKNPNRVWASYSSLGEATVGGHLFRSDDAGEGWQDVSGGLPNISINAVELDPLNTDTVYAAADMGVYRSVDAGAVWTSFNRGLPNALVKDLVFHAPSRLLRAATQSRGVWEIAVDQATVPNVDIYLRDSAVDSGRTTPAPSGVPDPFNLGARTFWWQCQDIKVDSPTFQKPNAADVDFEFFEDDHGVFAAGLRHENPQRGRTVRVFVQVHNRGANAAANVAVKVFYAAATIALPDLPVNFWNGFPNNVLAPDSPWKQIGPHKVAPSVEPGGARIVAFEWTVPASAPTYISMLAVITADNDPLPASELNIARLVTGNKKCGLKNMVVVNPSPSVGPPVAAISLDVGRAGAAAKFSLGADGGAQSVIRGLVLSKRLSALAKKAGLKEVELTAADKDEVTKLIDESPSLKKGLDTTRAFAPREGVWLADVETQGKGPESIMALINPDRGRQNASIIMWADDGTVVGGFTLQADKDE